MGKTFGVVAVRYKAGNVHIDSLQVGQIDGQTLGTMKEMTRAEVVYAIKSGDEFVSLVRTGIGEYKRGAKVEVFPVVTDYLKTESDSSTADNLESLPSF